MKYVRDYVCIVEVGWLHEGSFTGNWKEIIVNHRQSSSIPWDRREIQAAAMNAWEKGESR